MGRSPALVKRNAFLLLATAALGGCKEPSSGDQGSSFVQPGQDIEIHWVRLYASGENTVEGDTIYLVNFKYTNHLGYEFAPKMDHFIFQDSNQIRHAALQGGSAVTATISNYTGVLKKDESHDYTVGFRVYANATGLLFYDPS